MSKDQTKILITVIVEKFKLSLLISSLFIIVSLIINYYNKYNLYEDRYHLYFHNNIFLLDKVLRDSLIQDVLNIPNSKNNKFRFEFNKRTIIATSELEILDQKKEIIKHSKIIFSNISSPESDINPIKGIKKSSAKYEKYRKKTNPFFFFLMGYLICVFYFYLKKLYAIYKDET